ncbi:hypothetical protein [Modestobacter sp. SYSU DS0875]
MRLPRAARRELLDEVGADLTAAAADGVTPAELLGPDRARFAREAAQARGFPPAPAAWCRTVFGGVLGAAVALVVGYVVVVVLAPPLLASVVQLDGSYPTAGPVLAYVLMGLVCLAGTLVALATVLRDREAARATVTRAAVLLPVVGGIGLLAAMRLGADQDLTPGLVVARVLVVLAAVVAAIAGARWWALRGVDRAEPRRRATMR